jgi:inhibitor of cysteine peptidase
MHLNFISGYRLLLMGVFVLTACTPIAPAPGTIPAAPTPASLTQPAAPDSPLQAPGESEIVRGEAQVDGIDVVVSTTAPAQVDVIVHGNLADGCTELDPPVIARTGDTFQITLTTSRDGALMCTQALVPFEQTITLDGAELAAGEYLVDVNGVTASFSL